MVKMCSMCGEVKVEEENFRMINRSNGKNFRNCYCKKCEKLYIKEYMRIYRERRRESANNM